MHTPSPDEVLLNEKFAAVQRRVETLVEHNAARSNKAIREAFTDVLMQATRRPRRWYLLPRWLVHYNNRVHIRAAVSDGLFELGMSWAVQMGADKTLLEASYTLLVGYPPYEDLFFR